jgi:predicted Zn finger-like uncharacterized protein
VIINCKCGKYQFDVKKSELGTGNREVQCGICNLKWIHGNKLNSKNFYFSRVLFFFVIFFSLSIIALDYFQIFIVTNIPSFQPYYLAKEQLIINIGEFYYLVKEVLILNIGPYLK